MIIPPAATWTTHARVRPHGREPRERRVAFKQYREMGTARNLDEFAQPCRKYVALPWVNTIAADSQGNAFYGDISMVPHVTNAQARRVDAADTVVAQALFGSASTRSTARSRSAIRRRRGRAA